jgi:hypothetical protein
MTGITWQQTADKTTWQAAADRSVVLTVTRSADGTFSALAEGPGISDRASGFGRRSLAQSWAAQRAWVRA